MTAVKRFAKVVAKCRANFEKNSELVARKTKRRRWDPRTPGMNCPLVHDDSKHFKRRAANYFKFLMWSSKENCQCSCNEHANGCLCKDVNPDNAQKLRWCGLVETRIIDGVAHYVATQLGEEYIAAVQDCFMHGIL